MFINGELGSHFKASNGVRQGDPLAPYLFIIDMECLSCIPKDLVIRGELHPPRGKNDVYVSHILFANDVLFFLSLTKGTPNLLKIL